MLLQDLYDCSRPVMFEHDDRPEYPYELFGTGFVFRYREKRFLVTAKHVLRDRPAESLRVYADEVFATSMPFDVQTMPTDVDPDDWHYGDIVFLQIKHEMLTSEEVAAIDRVDLEQLRPGRAFSKGERLFVTGFPFVDRWIDFDEKRFGYRRVVASAIYDGASTSRDMHRMAAFNAGEVKDPNGFSGSPVFRIVKRDGFVVSQLAGMMTLGSFYLGSNVIFDVLDQIA